MISSSELRFRVWASAEKNVDLNLYGLYSGYMAYVLSIVLATMSTPYWLAATFCSGLWIWLFSVRLRAAKLVIFRMIRNNQTW